MNLREVKTKIKSFGNVKKITRAMQLVSAVKMRKAQEVAVQGRPYKAGLEDIVLKVLPTVDVSASPLLVPQSNPSDRTLIILFASHKGLCGSFNVSLFRVLLKEVDFKKTDFITIGKKGAQFINMMGGTIIADFSTHAGMMDTAAVFELALTRYFKDRYSKMYLLYNKYISTSRSEALKEQFMPFAIPEELKKAGEPTGESDYAIEPTSAELIDQLLKSLLEEKIRTAILNSDAAEHSARMIAMKNATDNATDLIYNLTLERNKLRQTKITSELLDMITAKESVEAA